MSLKPVHTTQSPWFYPTGNTPPVCLTQNLPPEQDAVLLLLGCGDIRNILFTAYSEVATNSRTLDFTCCDLEAEIIARNILALCLIVDDTKGERVQQLWNIYYHVFLDTGSATLLRSQARKLLAFTGSLQTWSDSPYATLVRFCDSTTLAAVAKLWKFYAIEPATVSPYKNAQTVLKQQWATAKVFQNTRISSSGFAVDILRAAAPLLLAGYEDMVGDYQTFWRNGTCLKDKTLVDKLEIANPMFFCNRSNLTVHYATNPLAGYHLAAAYPRLTADSPLADATTNVPIQKTSSKAMRAAITQLSEWCTSFRAILSRVTIRFINSDALAFCHVLKYHRTHGESSSANWYRSTWTYEPLVLDAPDYGKDGSAPNTFNVIDTSNLMDHLGCLNLLTATCTLLEQHPASCIRTEMLIPKEGNMADSASAMLCGDLPTVALLLGLKPVQYWSDATAAWHISQNPIPVPPGIASEKFVAAMSRPVVLWKPFDASPMQYDAREFAGLLLSMYLEMFQDENWMRQSSSLRLGDSGKQTTYELYTRASFVVFLRYIKEAGVSDWSETMRLFIEQGVLKDQTLNMGPHQLQSLFVHLENLAVWGPGSHMKWWHPRSFPGDLTGRFKGWDNMPATVCVTLLVPHAAVAMFGDINETKGTPLCQLQLHSSKAAKESVYTDIQLSFGSIKATGKAYSNDYALTVHEDSKGWLGDSPLVVSAMVSTYSLVKYGDEACYVAFALKNTAAVIAHYTSKLGFMLHLHKSAVGLRDVFVTRHRPNMKGRIGMGMNTSSPKTAPAQDTPHGISAHSVNDTAIFPVLNPRTNKVTSLRIRFNIVSEEWKALLQNRGTVMCETSNSSLLVLSINDKVQQTLTLPLPVNNASSKTRIARKSLWIGYNAPVVDPIAIGLRADSVFPMRPGRQKQVLLENLHYINANVLPKLYTGVKPSEVNWLAGVVSPKVTMSALEFKQYQMMLAAKAFMLPGRLGVKESLQSMYSHIFGLEGVPRGQIFQLCTPTTLFGVLYVDSVRMDISNQTTVIDAALIAHHSGPEMRTVGKLLSARGETAIGIKIQKEEANFWKHLLPAFAERCRQWKHKDTCEYKATGRVPLSIDEDKPYMCTCGMGIFPDNYLSIRKNSKQLLRHGIRVAIPVVFTSPINKDDPHAVTFASLPQGQNIKKKKDQPPARVPRVEDMSAKKNTCFECGAKQAKGGGVLLKCSKCKVAQYCSAECQKKEWKAHKKVCKQLQEE